MTEKSILRGIVAAIVRGIFIVSTLVPYANASTLRLENATLNNIDFLPAL